MFVWKFEYRPGDLLALSGEKVFSIHSTTPTHITLCETTTGNLLTLLRSQMSVLGLEYRSGPRFELTQKP